MRAEFNVKGDITKLGKILTQSVENVDNLGREIVESNSKIYYEALMDNIMGQKLSFAPLTPAYAARKGVLGLDSRVLIATGEYVNSIEIKELPKSMAGGGKLRYHVGVDQDVGHSGGINMGLLALVMEYGTADGRIPARPHYGVTWEQVLPEVCKNTLSYGRKVWQSGR